MTSPRFFGKRDNGYNSYNCYMPETNIGLPDLEAHPDFVRMEEERLKHWYQDGIVEKYLHKNDKSKKKFSFLDGPITANNPMGVHHGRGRTYKDLWQRYHTMKGERQRYQNGFDCQGLWVEVEVEKELGFKSKKDILGYGVEKFVEKCKQRVRKFAAIQTEQSRRLGMFMDWSNSYYTMSDENNYAIWNFLKVCHMRGWIYKGKDSVPWCPRCETAISQHEMLTEDYKEVTHQAIYLELPVTESGSGKEYLLVWTTTPWTLPANIAVAVDEKLDYSLVMGKTGDAYWIAKDAIERIFMNKGLNESRIIKTVKGKELVGLKYRGAFDDLAAVKKISGHPKFHTVIATDDRIMPISTAEGTGLVHTAVSAGSEDFQLGKKYGLPMIPVIEDNADYMPGLGEFSGKNAKKHPELIFDYLLKREKENGENWVFEIHDYKHRYPACWRCKTELVWKVTDEWYVAMDKPQKESSFGSWSTSTQPKSDPSGFGRTSGFSLQENPGPSEKYEVYEVTTFRTEQGYSDKRRPDKVEWGKSLEEDLARRDFTINAIALKFSISLLRRQAGNFQFSNGDNVEVEAEVVDPFGGQKDLENKLIRAVGNANERFGEDGLRMMRAIRLGANLGFSIEQETLAAIKENADLIKHIAWERIGQELIKTIAGQFPADGIMLLYQSGILNYILPELAAAVGVPQAGHHIYDVFTHSIESLRHCPADDPIVRLAALMHDVGKPAAFRRQGEKITFYSHEVVGARMAKVIADRLRLPVEARNKLWRLIRWHMFTYSKEMTDAAIRRFIRRVGKDEIGDMMMLRVGDRKGGGSRPTSWRLKELMGRVEILMYDPLAIKDLAVDGHDVMAVLGIKPGPKVGKVLNALFEEILEDPKKNAREYLMTRVRNFNFQQDYKGAGGVDKDVGGPAVAAGDE